MKKELDSVTNFIEKVCTGDDDKVAKEVATSIALAFHNENYDWVNAALATDPSNLCTMACVSLLRITFAKRQLLSNWPTFLNNVHNHFKNLGLDVSLRGLYS